MKTAGVIKGAILALTALSTLNAADISLVPTGSIAGRVKVNGGNSSNVPVYVNGTSIVGYSDNNGNFTITGVPVGTHSISATLGGFSTGTSSSLTLNRVGESLDAGTLTLDAASGLEKDLFISAEEKYARGDYESARGDFRQITGSGSYGEIAKYRIAISFYLEDRFDDALRELGTVNKSGQFGAKASYFTARAKEEKGDLSGAENDYRNVVRDYGGTESAIDAKDQLEEIVYDRGYDAYLAGNYSSAISGFDNFISEFPNSLDLNKARYYLGKSKESNLDGSGAISAFKQIPENSDRYLDARVEIARVQADQQGTSYSDAINTVNSIINKDRNSSQAAWAAEELGDLQWDNGDTASALSSYETYLRDFAANKEDSVAVLFTLGYKNYLKKDYNKAISWLTNHTNKASQQKKAASSWYYIGRAYEKKAVDPLNANDVDIVKAKEAYNKIIRDYSRSSKKSDAETRLTKLP